MSEITPISFNPKDFLTPSEQKQLKMSQVMVALQSSQTENELRAWIENTDALQKTDLKVERFIEAMFVLSAFAPFETGVVMPFDEFYKHCLRLDPHTSEKATLEILANMISIDSERYPGFIVDVDGIFGDFGVLSTYQNINNMTATFDVIAFQVIGDFPSISEAQKVLSYFASETELVQALEDRPGRFMVNPKLRELLDEIHFDEEWR